MAKIILAFLLNLFFLWFALSGATAQEQNDILQPELNVEIKNEFSKISNLVSHSLEAKNAGRSVVARRWMIVTANPHASDAGANILRQGGTAADALVAVQAVLGLVEPQSSGMGGGGFLIWYDANSGKILKNYMPLITPEKCFLLLMKKK